MQVTNYFIINEVAHKQDHEVAHKEDHELAHKEDRELAQDHGLAHVQNQ